MLIDPEIIDPRSDEGKSAKLNNSNYSTFIISGLAFISFVLILKLVIHLLLISIGILFIWNLATRKS